MKPKGTLFFTLLFLRQQFVQFWIEEREEKSQRRSTAPGWGGSSPLTETLRALVEPKADLWKWIGRVCWPETPHKCMGYSVPGVVYDTAWHCPSCSRVSCLNHFITRDGAIGNVESRSSWSHSPDRCCHHGPSSYRSCERLFQYQLGGLGFEGKVLHGLWELAWDPATSTMS